MRFWNFVTQLWPFRNSSSDRDRLIRRLPSPTVLSEPDECEDRTARSAFCYVAPEPDIVQTAEVIHVSLQQRVGQYAGTQSRFRRLSVVIVDYLLHHEWFYLLTGQRITQTGSKSSELEPARFITANDSLAGHSETDRTICESETEWSISSTMIAPSPPGSSTNETE
jgi:hypothetical protein